MRYIRLINSRMYQRPPLPLTRWVSDMDFPLLILSLVGAGCVSSACRGRCFQPAHGMAYVGVGPRPAQAGWMGKMHRAGKVGEWPAYWTLRPVLVSNPGNNGQS